VPLYGNFTSSLDRQLVLVTAHYGTTALTARSNSLIRISCHL